MFDLADDYQQFGGARRVVTSYVDQAIADGVLTAASGAPPQAPPATVNAIPATTALVSSARTAPASPAAIRTPSAPAARRAPRASATDLIEGFIPGDEPVHHRR
jgi:hypothetical protein